VQCTRLGSFWEAYNLWLYKVGFAASWLEAMNEAGLKKLEQPDFTASARLGAPSLVVTSERDVPESYWMPQPPRLDRQTLTSDLRRGDQVPGACLGNAAPILTVRTK
jgi:hypothetical protein